MTSHDETNRYSPETPEWQLFEAMVSAKRAAAAYDADATRYMRLSQQSRIKEATYRAALLKLTEPTDTKGER